MGVSLAAAVPSALVLAMAASLKGIVYTPYLLLPLVYSSFIGFSVAILSHPSISVNTPRILCKTSQGQFPLWSSIVFYPYLAGAELYVRFRRWTSIEAIYTEICDGLFVGAWPTDQVHIPPGNPAIVDCTNELPRRAGLELPYLCIPCWDTRAPSAESVELAVRWALAKRSQNHSILIHCAKGHGRSVTVMCALLVGMGVVGDWKEGESLIKRHRPRIRLNRMHKKTLQAWQELRRSSS